MKIDQTASATPVILADIAFTGICDDVISDYLWARAVVLTSPTVATIGMSITITLAMISDLLLGKQSPTVMSGLGAFLVALGFVFLHTDNSVWVNLGQRISGCFNGRNSKMSLQDQSMAVAPSIE